MRGLTYRDWRTAHHKRAALAPLSILEMMTMEGGEDRPSAPTKCKCSGGAKSKSAPANAGDGSSDPLYQRLVSEALQAEEAEPLISCLIRRTVLDPDVRTFEQAVAASIAHRMDSLCGGGSGGGSAQDIDPRAVRNLIDESLLSDERELGWTMAEAVREDAMACIERDPACYAVLEPLLFFKGFASLVLHRAARRRWGKAVARPGGSGTFGSSRYVSYWLQSQASALFGVDIHPAATIGKGIMLDHATGIVIGETAVVGDGCSLLHGVTLGGTGTEGGADRHPKIGRDVLLGANTSVLGNIRIGDGAKVGANSVVLQPIPSGATAVGAPAKVVGRAMESKPGTQNDTSMRDVVMLHFHPHGSGGEGRMRKGTRHPLDRRRSKSVGSSHDTDNDSGQDHAHAREGAAALKEIAWSEVGGDVPGANPDEGGEAGAGASNLIGGGGSMSSSDEEERKADVTGADFSGSTTCLQKEMDIWRSFATAEAPQGSLNVYQLCKLLQKKGGTTEAEAGEVFFSLMDNESPYVAEGTFRERFPEVARRFTNMDEGTIGSILECICNITSPSKAAKKSKTTGKGGRPERSQSIPHNFFSSEISNHSGIDEGRGGMLATIVSDSNLADSEMEDAKDLFHSSAT